MRTFRIISYTILSTFFLLSSVNSFAATAYVDKNNLNPRPPHNTWGSAATSIQEAVDATTDGDSVLVTNGNYTLTSEITVTKSIRIESVNGPYETIVNGNGFCRGFNLGGNECVVSGFTVTNCNAGTASEANNGGGFLCLDNTPIITNCVITANVGHDGGGTFRGSVYNCKIVANEASSSGGGVDWAYLSNCLITDNYAGFRGGGVAHADLLNCTVVDNNAGGDGNGLFRCSATNSIIYYNNGEDVYWESNPYYQSQIGYSCGSDLSHGGVGNITTVPKFLDVAGGDYRLSSSSPCIDNGINSAAPREPDLDGNPRIQNGIVDMGAYEYQDLASGLVAYYPLDGNANDASGNGNDGVEQGGLGYQNGVSGLAASFNAIDAWIEIADSPELRMGINSFTVACWIKTSSDKKHQTIWYKGPPHGTAGSKWYAGELIEGKARLGIDDNINKSQPLTADAFNLTYNDGQWHHVVFVRNQDKGCLEVYKDGSLDYTFPDSTLNSIANNYNVFLGRFNDYADKRYVDGLIDELRVYNRALSQSEIETLYKETGGGVDGNEGIGGIVVGIERNTTGGKIYRVEWKRAVNGS